MVAEAVPAYGRFVEGERARLGADHPLFKTQYELVTIAGETGFFQPSQRAQLAGGHPRRAAPVPDGTYVAALDVAGGTPSPSPSPSGEREDRDSTVLLLARVLWLDVTDYLREPLLLVEQVYTWRGADLRSQYRSLLDLLRNVWHVQRLAIDATGLGRGLADFLAAALAPGVVEPVVFTSQSKSNLGYDLLAATSAGRLKWYAGDDAESREFWHEVDECRYAVKPNRVMSWAVPESRGHDDYLSALALLVAAGKEAPSPPAAVEIVAPDPFDPRFERWGGFA